MPARLPAMTGRPNCGCDELANCDMVVRSCWWTATLNTRDANAASLGRTWPRDLSIYPFLYILAATCIYQLNNRRTNEPSSPRPTPPEAPTDPNSAMVIFPAAVCHPIIHASDRGVGMVVVVSYMEPRALGSVGLMDPTPKHRPGT